MQFLPPAVITHRKIMPIPHYVIGATAASIPAKRTMHLKKLSPDPRYFQVIFQVLFLAYGLFWLDWSANWIHYIVSVAGCLLVNYIAESVRRRKILPFSGPTGFNLWGFSVLISAMSLCLLLKTTHWYTSMLAVALTVMPKFFIRVDGRHVFNPSALGIVLTIWISGDAWLSPGQWGSNAVLFFLVVTLGTIVVTRVQQLDVSLAFLLTFAGLLFWRQVYVLGWPADYFRHSVLNGSLLLFTFFMISDPKTSPNHRVARIAWAMLIAGIAFYLAAFRWMYSTPVWVLVCAAPLVPLLNRVFKHRQFEWSLRPSSITAISTLKNVIMKFQKRKIAAVIVLLTMASNQAMAFCGFYVSKADGTLKNKTSQVIIVHDGTRNVITMYNDFKGNIKDFAMVVPVPVVLKKSDIKVVDQQIFNTLNEYSQPRLVEYYDENPCQQYYNKREAKSAPSASLDEVVVEGYGTRSKTLGVKIEAKYLVGEYDILILSARESAGLQTWLTENGYKIPESANEVLAPYIKSNLKFFVVKVNEQEKKKFPGDFLRPIQIAFNSPKFMLPIRLGMANADGDQDMIVYAFTKTGRIECTNYRTVSLPTAKNIPLFVKNDFSSFFSNLFQHQWKRQGEAVAMLEYAWDVSPQNYVKCDPCVATAPSLQDLAQAGVWWVTRDWNDYNNDDIFEQGDSRKVHFTRLHVRYNRSAFPQDLMFDETSNTENFQARYIITHPASGNFNCEAGKRYLKELKVRREGELAMLTQLTGKGYDDWDVVDNTADANIPVTVSYAALANEPSKDGKKNGILYATLGLVGLLSVAGLRQQRRKH